MLCYIRKSNESYHSPEEGGQLKSIFTSFKILSGQLRLPVSMAQAITITTEMTEQNQRLEEAVRDNRNKLFAFIRQRVNSSTDAEDVLQDVFEELTEAYR